MRELTKEQAKKNKTMADESKSANLSLLWF